MGLGVLGGDGRGRGSARKGAMGKRLVARLPGALRGVKKLPKLKVGNQEY